MSAPAAPLTTAPRRAIVWFRNDLRLHDNPVLAAAAVAKADEVVPVYCFDPRQFGKGSFGCAKTSAMRARFLLESVTDLRRSLRDLGSDLIVGVGRPEALLPSLVPAGGASVVCAEQVCSEELEVDRLVSAALAKTRSSLQPVWSGTIYERDEIERVFGALGAMPDGFTPFRNKVEAKAASAAPLAAPKRGALAPLGTASTLADAAAPPGAAPWSAGALSATAMPSLADLGFDAEEARAAGVPDERAAISFAGGERVALARVKHYLWDADCLATYFETRNGMLGADYSSKLAPWLALGCLSPRAVKEQCEAYEAARVKNKSTYWLVFELLWRDFYRFYALKHGDALFRAGGPAGVEREWRRDAALEAAWREGRTGVPLVDANMRELKATGFMSNRGRQNVASYLALDLQLDWRTGAAHFEEHLLDYDCGSNWGNWAAAAGATGGRINRFNLLKQSHDYDADGAYVRHWLPELAKVPAGSPKVHAPWELSNDEQRKYGVTIGVDYPRPPESRWAGFPDAGKGKGGKGGGRGRRDDGGGRGRGDGGKGGGKGGGRAGRGAGRKRVQHDFM